MSRLVNPADPYRDAGPEPAAAELLGRAARARAASEARTVEAEYGEFRGLVFDPTLVDAAFVPAGEASRSRLRRRVLTKILEAQIWARRPRPPVDPSSSSPLSSSSSDGEITAAATKFVWATAGDSAAAGHGNLLSQSYTSVLEDTVRDAFRAVGVTFEARNYAMGGYVSGPELSLCMESVYGPDVDALMWDFGLAEGVAPRGAAAGIEGGDGGAHRAALWGERAGSHPSRPVLFLADYGRGIDDTGGGALSGRRWAEFALLESKGLSAVLWDKSVLDSIRTRVPDSDVVTNPGVLLPPALRYYVCSGMAEGTVPCDDPMRNFVCDAEGENGSKTICGENKWDTQSGCGLGGVRFQTSWHPGW